MPTKAKVVLTDFRRRRNGSGRDGVRFASSSSRARLASRHPHRHGDTAISASDLTVPVLLGSVRPERQALRAGRMVVDALKAAGHEAIVVDPLELRLPLLERTYSEYGKGEAPAGLDGLAGLYRRSDGFIIVSGEYNNGIPPALKKSSGLFPRRIFLAAIGDCLLLVRPVWWRTRCDAAAYDPRRVGHAQHSDAVANPAHRPRA